MHQGDAAARDLYISAAELQFVVSRSNDLYSWIQYLHDCLQIVVSWRQSLSGMFCARETRTSFNNVIATIRQARTMHYAKRRRNPHQSPLTIMDPLLRLLQSFVDPRIVFLIQWQSGAYAPKCNFPGPCVDFTCMYPLQGDSRDLEFTCNATRHRHFVAQ